MGAAENEAVVRRIFEAFSRKEGFGLRGLFAEDAVWIVPGRGAMSGTHRGRDEIFRFLAGLLKETDGTYGSTLRDVLASADRAAALYTAQRHEAGQDARARAGAALPDRGRPRPRGARAAERSRGVRAVLGDMSRPRRSRRAVTAAEEEKRTGFLELFFDLVFVFAFTQVATLVIEDTSAAGFARAAIVFALIWWAWSAYAWLTNAIDVENIATRLFVFAAMLATFFLALAVPDAYTDEGAWFAVAYFVVRVLHVALYVWGVRGDPAHRAAVVRLAPWFLAAPTVALAGGLLDDPWRTWLWVGSIAIDVVGTLFAQGFRVSAAHFAERYALIVIIALGESIVAIGVSAVELERDAVFALAVAVSFAGAAAAWWAYFDISQVAVERALHAVHDESAATSPATSTPSSTTRSCWGSSSSRSPRRRRSRILWNPSPTAGEPRSRLGFSLFLLGFVLFRYRVIRRIAWERIEAAAVVLLVVFLPRTRTRSLC